MSSIVKEIKEAVKQREMVLLQCIKEKAPTGSYVDNKSCPGFSNATWLSAAKTLDVKVGVSGDWQDMYLDLTEPFSKSTHPDVIKAQQTWWKPW